MGPLTKEIMLKALQKLDQLIPHAVTLVIGGGGAMILAHDFPLGTTDIDAVPKGIELHELDFFVKKIATEHGLPTDWLNPYFSTFAHTLPSDYGQRLVDVFVGKKLTAKALSKNEMLIMKCFAHRAKDTSHARALIKKGADTDVVETHIQLLKKKGIKGSQEALDFLHEQLDELGL